MSSYETNPVGALQVMVLNVLSLLVYNTVLPWHEQQKMYDYFV